MASSGDKSRQERTDQVKVVGKSFAKRPMAKGGLDQKGNARTSVPANKGL